MIETIAQPASENVQIAMLIVEAIQTFAIFVGVWILRDLRDRIFRLEDRAMNPKISIFEKSNPKGRADAS